MSLPYFFFKIITLFFCSVHVLIVSSEIFCFSTQPTLPLEAHFMYGISFVWQCHCYTSHSSCKTVLKCLVLGGEVFVLHRLKLDSMNALSYADCRSVLMSGYWLTLDVCSPTLCGSVSGILVL